MIGETIFLLMLYIGLPVFLSWLILRAAWIEIAKAYGIWIGLCVFAGVLLRFEGLTSGEAAGWPLILSMFYIWIAIPVTILLMRGAGLVCRLVRKTA